MTAEHSHELYWHADPCNERGWKCIACDYRPGEPAGFSPERDRSHLVTKIESILHTLHDAEIVYVSNGDHGAWIASRVASACRARDLYDSVSIARLVLEVLGDAAHAKFWRDISEGILVGRDPRPRCHCGKLSNAYVNGKRYCSEHGFEAIGAEPF